MMIPIDRLNLRLCLAVVTVLLAFPLTARAQKPDLSIEQTGRTIVTSKQLLTQNIDTSLNITGVKLKIGRASCRERV